MNMLASQPAIAPTISQPMRDNMSFPPMCFMYIWESIATRLPRYYVRPEAGSLLHARCGGAVVAPALVLESILRGISRFRAQIGGGLLAAAHQLLEVLAPPFHQQRTGVVAL